MASMTIQQAIELANRSAQAGQFGQAESFYRQILAVASGHQESSRMLAWVVAQQGRFDEAAVLYRQLLATYPSDAIALLQWGNLLFLIGRSEEAIGAFSRAASAKGDFADPLYNMGIVLRSLDRLDESVSAFERAVAIAPNYAEAHSNLGSAYKDCGELDRAIASYRRALSIKPDPRTASNLLFALLFHPDFNSTQILEENRRWNDQYAAPLKSLATPHANDRSPDRRLRIGYVSGELRDHPVGRSMMPLLEQRDREAFEVFCYADVRRADEVTRRLQSSANIWRDITRLPDAALVQQIRADRIDILVDLAMHLGGNRLLAFAQKPAPVQVAWQAYPGTTGLWAMDYRLTDPWLDPPGSFDADYSERSIRLRDSFWIYEPISGELSVNALQALASKDVTFGCLNNFCKINDGVLALWGRVMTEVASSRLILLAPHGSARQRVLNTLGQHGINPNRIEFVGLQPRPQYLQTYHRIDIGLDTFPYNGHMTSLDSLWMGVPVVTLIGQTVVGRAGWSQLNNLGLADLAAQTPEQFVEIAVNLANDLDRLAELRRSLRSRMEASALMDRKRYAQSAEIAYRQMWREWCEKTRATEK
ncbi:MAG TPA: tetratricopeptide repeat protein [Tepidisphaeraceae bacterium]|nr:tetratricopeptide repeat protein [Tepidisphaeraceae bacterium]